MSIRVEQVSKRFGSYQALDQVSVEAPSGGLLALLGPSGSGKTTLLRIIAGLETPDSGAIYYEGEEVTRSAARDRQVGFVFQHYALFRHLSVFENVAFGLRVRRWPDARVRERVSELLHLVRLEGLEQRRPSQLSGGQRQRVALARALAAQPRVLLLDEPFGALDARVRQELRQWLRRLHETVRVTTIFVTHDQEEAFEVADNVAVLHQGRVEQVGPPQAVFERPRSAFVMDFLGQVNVFHGRVEAGQAWLGSLAVPCPDYPHTEPRSVPVFVRPHELGIERIPEGPALAARVERVGPAGAVVRVQLLALEGGLALSVELSRERAAELNLRPDEMVYVVPHQVRVFVPEYSI
jgi:sulfate transport system ATP-binding protein